MKKITQDDLKGKINNLVKETKRLTNRKKDKYSQKTSAFGTLSNNWIIYYSYLNILNEEEKEKYLKKLNEIAKVMADFAILGR